MAFYQNAFSIKVLFFYWTRFSSTCGIAMNPKYIMNPTNNKLSMSMTAPLLYNNTFYYIYARFFKKITLFIKIRELF